MIASLFAVLTITWATPPLTLPFPINRLPVFCQDHLLRAHAGTLLGRAAAAQYARVHPDQALAPLFASDPGLHHVVDRAQHLPVD